MSVRCCERAIARVRAQVGKGKMVYGLSGGVESSVVAALLPVRTAGGMGAAAPTIRPARSVLLPQRME